MRSTRKGKEKGTKNVEMGRGKVRKKGERERERVGVGDPSPRVGDSQSLHFSLGPLSSHNLQKKKTCLRKTRLLKTNLLLPLPLFRVPRQHEAALCARRRALRGLCGR